MVNRFGVKWTPTIILFDSNGGEHHRFIGFFSPEDFIGHIMLGRAKAEFDQDNFEQAIQYFQEVLVRYPKADAAPEAQYFLGVSRYKASHDPKQLRLGLEALQRDYPNSEWTKKAQVYASIP